MGSGLCVCSLKIIVFCSIIRTGRIEIQASSSQEIEAAAGVRRFENKALDRAVCRDGDLIFADGHIRRATVVGVLSSTDRLAL